MVASPLAAHPLNCSATLAALVFNNGEDNASEARLAASVMLAACTEDMGALPEALECGLEW